MTKIPTFAELEAAGADAGALIDAVRAELERGIAMAANKAARSALAKDIKALDRLHAKYFGDEA